MSLLMMLLMLLPMPMQSTKSKAITEAMYQWVYPAVPSARRVWLVRVNGYLPTLKWEDQRLHYCCSCSCLSFYRDCWVFRPWYNIESSEVGLAKMQFFCDYRNSIVLLLDYSRLTNVSIELHIFDAVVAWKLPCGTMIKDQVSVASKFFSNKGVSQVQFHWKSR